jgi:nucleoid DNA-binding protein
MTVPNRRKTPPAHVARSLKVRGLTQRQVDAVLRAFAAHVVSATRNGARVTVPGLGVFRPRARMGSTRQVGGATYEIPAKLLLTFRAALAVRQLDGGKARRIATVGSGSTNDTQTDPGHRSTQNDATGGKP